MNQTDLYDLFELYNLTLFENELCSEISIEFVNLSEQNLYGSFDLLDGSIYIHCELDRIETKWTLIHEMIHLWQWQKYRQLNHKIRFTKKADELSKIVGFNIPIYIDD